MKVMRKQNKSSTYISGADFMAFNIKQYLLNKPEAIEDFPFGPEVAVYKVRDKLFALPSIGHGKRSLTIYSI